MIENREFQTKVPDTSKAGWDTTVERDTTTGDIIFIKSHQVRLGVDVIYGQGPDGYDQWTIRKPNGGGSVVIPYLWIGGELYVGANRQKRSATGGFVTEVPRGFTLPTETHEEAAKREFMEETGAVKSLAERVRPLKGKPTNSDSAFVIANPRKGEGDKLFGVEIYLNEVVLKWAARTARREVWEFTPEMAGEIKEVNEKIKPEGIRFFHVSLLSQTSDAFTLQAIARLSTQAK